MTTHARTTHTWTYAFFGAFFGAAFPVGATLLDAGLGFDLSLSGLLAAQRDQPLHWVIDTAPFWLGLFASFAGRRQDQLEELLRVQRLTNQELREANADLVRARKLKSEFLANVSHELRTPLNAIIGFSRIVIRKSEGALPAKQARNLERILDSGLVLLDIVNDLLDIERIEAGMMEVTADRVDLGALIGEVVATLTPKAEEKGLAVSYTVDPAGLVLETDEGRVRQILVNLVMNAIKYSDTGHVRVTAVYDPATSQALRLAVRDQGIGISEKDLVAIFEAFQQVDGSATRKQGGVGLGLHLVRKLAQLLGGDVEVESEVGVGSTFTLTLPARGVSLRPQSSSVDALEPVGDGPVLLVIDDESQAIEILQTDLADAGFRVHGALSPAAGLQKAREILPDAILLDMLMPEADGWQLLAQLEGDPELARIPVIVVSSADPNAAPADRDVVAWLRKPLGTDRFREVFSTLQTLTGLDVLLVEDDPATEALVRQQLTDLGLRCRTARDGQQAIAALRDRMPGAVVLDLGLPEADGFTVMQALRQMPGGADVTVVVYSARDLADADRARLDGGPVRFIGKGSADGLERVSTFVRRAIAASGVQAAS